MLIKSMNVKILMIPLIIMAVFVSAFIYLIVNDKNTLPELLRGVAVSPPKVVQSVNLVDHHNKVVSIERLKKYWTFVFFGYTNCPDVCPATIAQLKLIKRGIKENTAYAKSTQFFFVSVDPQRDTLDHLAKYMKYFDSSFVGMTGSEKAITGFEQQLNSYHRIGTKNLNGDYTVQHSAEIYLIDSDAMLVAKFQPPMDTGKIVRQFSEFVSLKNETLS